MPSETLRLTFADEPVAVPRVRNASAGALYDAGGTQTRRTMLWRAPTASANAAILANLTTLRDRSHAATRNDGYAKGVIDELVSNIVGTGIQPLSQGPEDYLVPHPVTGVMVPFPEAIQALFLIWTDESDADGLLDWYGQVAQAVRVWLEGGESFSRLRPRLKSDGLSVPIQVQVLEPELCPHTHNVLSATSKIRAGIEFNAIGKRVAYWFHPSRPEQDDYDTSRLGRVAADSICHLFDPLRAGQIRGLPHLTAALICLYELDKCADAVVLRHQLQNLFVMLIRRPTAVGDAETVHPLTGLPVDTAPDGTPMIGMEPGITQELAPGEEVEFSDPPDATGYPEFMRQQLMKVATATGVPYEVLTGDMSKVNDRTVRVILNAFRRRIQAKQHQIVVFQLCRKVWRAWMDRVFLSGALPIPLDYIENPGPWLAVKWVPQGWPYLQPVQDVQAKNDAIRSGLSSRSAEVGETGEDAEVIDAQQAADNKRADNLGLKYDSDGRQPKNAAPVPMPDPNQGDPIQPAVPA